jgi:hypothetical protein
MRGGLRDSKTLEGLDGEPSFLLSDMEVPCQVLYEKNNNLIMTKERQQVFGGMSS